jgi:hypothetical protein
MAQSGADKGCCGNFAQGVPGIASDPSQQCFADCCNICPPDCCDTIILHYECGDPPPSTPCCGGPSYLANPRFESSLYPSKKESTKYFVPGQGYLDLPDLPNFEQDDETILLHGFGFGPGSCPCEPITVTITTSACCLIGGGGSSVTVVGDGTVSASGPGSAANGCGTYVTQLSVNGGPWTTGSVAVSDNDSVSVRVMSIDGDCNCGCCLLSAEDPCEPYGPAMFSIRSVSGGLKLIVNQDAILRRYRSLKATQMKVAYAKFKRQVRTPKTVKRVAMVPTKKQAPIF